MRARRQVVLPTAKIGLLFLGICMCSCNALKRVEDDQLLLSDYEILADGEKIGDPAINSLVIQKPNSRVLGFPLRLHLFNLAKKDPDSSFQNWLNKKEKRQQRLESLLSRKQVERLGESFLVKGYSEWLKNVGEPPVIIDSSKVEKTLGRLSNYYNTQGYFNNTGHFSIDSVGRKRAETRYSLDLGKPYIIDSLTQDIASAAIDSLYQLNRDNSLVREGEQFNLDNFTRERERLTTVFRNSGIWNFQESSISYDIIRDTVKTREDQQMNVELNIDNLRSRQDSAANGTEYRVHRMGNINIFADHNFTDTTDSLQTLEYNNYTIYYKNRLRYKPKALTDAIFLQKDSVYRDIDRLRTYRQISNLNTFRYPNIELLDRENDRLDANVYLAARPRNSLSLDFDITHSNIQRLGIGLGAALITRNIFGGAETLSLSARGNFGLLSDESLPEDYFSEVGGDINLTFPRIWFPGFAALNPGRLIPFYMLPQTRVSLGTTFQKNLGLDKQTFNNVLAYNWSPTDHSKHQIELLNVQFVRNVNPDRFFNVYQSTYRRLDDIADNYEAVPGLENLFVTTGDPADPLRLSIPEGTNGFIDSVLANNLIPPSDPDYVDVSRIAERQDRLTENNLIFTTNYTYTRDSKTDINDNSFYSFRWKIESAGNLLSGISRIIPFEEDTDGNKLVFGVPYSQYVKTEFDYIKHWELSTTDVLAFHSFIGIAIPYGNANDIPFLRSYFAGGSNDNRAWFPYSLGPGSSQNINDFNEANFKIAMNLEYRFPLFGNFRGALFADLGNIWNIWDREDDPAATFTGFSSLADIGLGTGFGLRYDFTYFVFRADIGFKTYNPAEIPSKRWFRDYNFANSVLQIGINYPF
ncbi:translocation and assembly module lipoprotein TamL [Robiginitalea sp. IMCC44478]|uniref:translocation and assembly module lipoprotein TamL n=1 Tax=Robiginitalea sp. IMCC44478 TaxID=3459122 RepID=UPI00404165E7